MRFNFKHNYRKNDVKNISIFISRFWLIITYLLFLLSYNLIIIFSDVFLTAQNLGNRPSPHLFKLDLQEIVQQICLLDNASIVSRLMRLLVLLHLRLQNCVPLPESHYISGLMKHFRLHV